MKKLERLNMPQVWLSRLKYVAGIHLLLYWLFTFSGIVLSFLSHNFLVVRGETIDWSRIPTPPRFVGFLKLVFIGTLGS